jgi:small subunit ribosomal protein S13
MSSTEFKHLVRLGGKDLDGSKKILAALSDIKGVGYNFANALVSKLGINPHTRLGSLSEQQINEIESALKGVSDIRLPEWIFNRRKDPETGETKQLLSAELEFVVKNDIEREKSIQSWKGIRHSLGLKVRGQRTRTTGRKGRTVGVRKSAQQPAQKEQEKKEK